MSTPAHDLSSFDDVLDRRFGRRAALKAAAAGAGGIALLASGSKVDAAGPFAPGELTYDPVPPNGNDAITLPPGFTHDVIISWGDPVVAGAPAFNIQAQTQVAQERQCGFNHDYLAFLPIPYGSGNSDTGLLWINHEYTDSTMMFENYTSSATQVNVEMAAHGGTVVRVNRSPSGAWSYDPLSVYNRRIHAKTWMEMTGPVRSDPRIQTDREPSGTMVQGMLNNCGGGVTPWGTILTCEENFDQYFANGGAGGANIPDPYVKSTVASVGVTAGPSQRKWEVIHDRFDLTIEPREYLKFGWVVEIDPYSPSYVPKKRTALGRFKHEAAAGVTSTAGKYVVYSGDDQVNNYIYKFVTAANVNPTNRAANANILDNGTLYVARFDPDGSGVWLPLVHDQSPTLQASFTDQVDVLIRTRQAATALGATKMSRPEDVEVNPVTKKVYAVMTGNSGGEVNAANPRAAGSSIAGQGLGHVIEIVETGGDNAALTFTWNVFLLCGQPNQSGSVAANSVPSPALSTATPNNVTYWAGFDETKVSPIARVDNVSFDSRGNMFLSTDGQPSALSGSDPSDPTKLVGWNDCLVGFPVEGAERGHGKTLMTAVDGCEVTGPYFTPDDRTVFVSIQHPGVDVFNWTSASSAPAAPVGTFAAPGSSWNTTPAIAGKTPGVPRPAAIAIRRLSGTQIAYGVDVDPPVVPEFPMPAVAVGAAAVIGGLVAFRHRRLDPAPE